ncbi:MAG: MGMT family protein [Rhodopirellula sp.]|nr:MGMT family protein [Rhodopirellula sp.]
MPHVRKTWRQKLDAAKAKVSECKVFKCEQSGKVFVVPSPVRLEQIIRSLPWGELITMQQLAQRLAAEHGADLACPMTTGIFCRLIAEAVEESSRPGAVPWWRVLKTGNELNPKYPGGGLLQRQRLEAEGHRVKPVGKKLIVAD